MLLLVSTSALLSLVTSGTAEIDVHADWCDLSGSPATVTPGTTNTAITTATTTTIIGSPAASTQRNIKNFTVRNADASNANTVTIQHNDGTTTIPIFKMSLPAGWLIQWDDAGWQVFDNLGNLQVIQTCPGTFIQSTVLTNTASSTFTTTSKTRTIRVRMVGGGGGGGGCTSVASAAGAAGGGGAGGYAEKVFAVAPSTGYTYQCGAAGAGSSGGAGFSGSDTTFTVGGTTVTAKGSNDGTGHSGPVATSTTTVPSVFAAGPGGVVSTNGDLNGAGETGTMGIITAVTPVGISGNGGSGPFGGGGKGLTSAGAGNNAAGFGAGGGGALTGASAARAGGNGTAGCIVVDEYT